MAWVYFIIFETIPIRNVRVFSLEHLMLERVSYICKTSADIGKLALLENPVLIKLRNAMMKYAPDFINKKQFEKIFSA